MRLLLPVMSALLLLKQSQASGEQAPTGRPPHTDEGSPSQRPRTGREPAQKQQPGSAFNLQVTVNDGLSRQPLSQAAVDVYINYTRTNAALTGDDGAALLRAPYRAGLPVVVVASKRGYISSPVSLNTRKKLIFSSVTISLLGLSQGSIWLFEDALLITGRTSDASSQPVVQFPKTLLNVTDSRDVTSVKAYLSFPKLLSDGHGLPHTFGIMSRTSGYVSVELRPVAAVNVQLFSGNTELDVSGPIVISLRVTDARGLQPADAVPAWFFNHTTGAWMRSGLGTVASVDGHLLWTFTAPRLGYWIAAPLPSTRGFLGLSIPTDGLTFQHSSLLMLLLGGTLLVIVCLLVGLGCCHRRSVKVTTAKKIPPVTRKDQTTCTRDEEVCESSADHASYAQNGPNRSAPHRSQHTASRVPLHGGSVIANASAAAITLQAKPEPDAHLTDPTTQRMRALTENLIFLNRPVAVLHAPACFHLEGQPDQRPRSRSATLPRAASTSADTELANTDTSPQTLPKGPTQNQTSGADDQLGDLESCPAASSSNASRAHFSLPESMSVPGTLNKIREGRRSVNALVDLSKIPPAPAPRAWFVSLEGKPAAEIRYAVSEQQRRRRPVESRETSLDSGVDVSELNPSTGRRTVALERNATFVKSSTRTAPQ